MTTDPRLPAGHDARSSGLDIAVDNSGLRRLSLNQKTINQWSLAEAVDGCRRAGLPAIGLWREAVHAIGVTKAARMVADSGLRVSSLCRAGFFTAEDAAQRLEAVDDSRRAIDEAAQLAAACLVVVVGGLATGSRDLMGARLRAVESIAALVDDAAAAGVRLAIEPMHPMYCADRGVLSTLGQALDVAEQFPAEHVGVVVDTFHVWWDPQLMAQIARAGDRIASLQVGDWITPLPPDALLSRGMMGDGHIDFQPMVAAVDSAGYSGDIEVEIFNADLWAANPEHLLATLVRRYLAHVIG